MALADRVTNRPKPTNGLPCSIAVLLDTLEGDELEAFRAMLGTPGKRDGWSAAEIYEAVTAEGHSIGLQSINRHRSDPPRCRCGATR